MGQLQSLDVSVQDGSLPIKFAELVRQLNDRLRTIRGVGNANEGAAIRWTEAAVPTASVTYAGRLLYHDLGQGATADNLYVCLWNGAAWAWTLLA